MAAPRYTRHVNDLYPTLEQIIDAGEAVEALTSHPGWLAVQELIAAERAAIDEILEAGNVPLTQAEYALAHGRRSGLKAAEEAARALIGRYQSRLKEQQLRHERGTELPQEAAR